MTKSVNFDSFDSSLADLIGEGISEILAEGLDVECPGCGKEFVLDFDDPKCPHCGMAVKIEY